jgi:hypothetical protein
MKKRARALTIRFPADRLLPVESLLFAAKERGPGPSVTTSRSLNIEVSGVEEYDFGI